MAMSKHPPDLSVAVAPQTAELRQPSPSIEQARALRTVQQLRHAEGVGENVGITPQTGKGDPPTGQQRGHIVTFTARQQTLGQH